VPVSRSQFCVLLPETLLEELLGDVVEELLGEVLEPVLLLGEVLDDELLGEALEPVLLLGEVLDDELLGEVLEPALLLGVALVLPEPTLEPDDPMLPLLDDCANAAAEIASSAALTAALSTLKFMLAAPSKVEKLLQPLMSKRCAVARRAPLKRLREHRRQRAAVRAASTHALRVGSLRALEEGG
jgi:hypothetical protein